MAERHSRRVLIVGAGIGGLAAALALARRGFAVEVYEQAEELREVGAGLQLSANATRALAALGVLEPLAALACEAEGKEIRLWNSGERWKLFDLGAASIERYGFPYLMVYRPDLIAVLAEALVREVPNAIRLGARCTRISQDESRVVLELQGGDRIEGEALIGADGVHSRVREVLFGEDRPKFTGVVAWRAVVPIERLPQHLRHNVGVNWIGAGGHVVHYPLARGRLMNFVGIRERDDWRIESWSTQGERAECARDFSGWHDDVHAMIRGAPALYKWALVGRAPLARWTIGRATLLGDAAHPMLPMLAQGAAMAIEDGLILARCFERYPDPSEALARYENARHERATRAVLGSAEMARRFHNPKLADAAGAREYVEHEWSEERIRERYEWLFTYDATAVPV